MRDMLLQSRASSTATYETSPVPGIVQNCLSILQSTWLMLPLWQCCRSHNAHYALCVGHQVLRGHQNHHTGSYNNYNADIISFRNIRHRLGMYITKQNK